MFTRSQSKAALTALLVATTWNQARSQGCNGAPATAAAQGCVCPAGPSSIQVGWTDTVYIPVLLDAIPGDGQLDPGDQNTLEIDPVSQPPQGISTWNPGAGATTATLSFRHTGQHDACAEFGVGRYRLLDSCGVYSNWAPYSIYMARDVVNDCNCNCEPSDAPYNGDGNPFDDRCEIHASPFLDCNGNGYLDSVESTPFLDCDGDGRSNSENLNDPSNPSQDVDGDAIPDECQEQGLAATTELASLTSTHGALSGAAFAPGLSSDGRLVTFVSAASPFLPSTANGKNQLFLLDRGNGAVSLISRTPSGQPANGHSSGAQISRNLRYIAFASSATDLASGDSDSSPDIYVQDRSTGVTQLISKRPGQTIHGICFAPTLSSNGEYVAFISYSDLTPAGPSGAPYAYVWSRSSGAIGLASVSTANVPVQVEIAALSRNGSKLAFVSSFNSIVPNDLNGDTDVFVCDRANPSNVSLVSRQFASGLPAGGCVYLSISTSGNHVAFSSFASTIVPGDTNGASDVFVRDITAGTTTLVSSDAAGASANNGSSSPSISGEGGRVAFSSLATNLVSTPGSFSPHAKCYLRDLATNQTALVNRNVSAVPSQAGGEIFALSGDGRSIAFADTGSNMLDGSPTSLQRVFVRDFGARNRSLHLDGSSWASLPKRPCQEFGGPFTIEFWLQPEALGLEQVVLSKWNDNEKSYEIGISAGGSVQFRMARSAGQNASAEHEFEAGQLVAGEWSHVACIFDGAARRILINGVLAAEKPSSGPPHPSRAGLSFGARGSSSGQPQKHFVGWIDELRLWREARTTGQIQRWLNERIRRQRLFDHPQLVAAYGFEYPADGLETVGVVRDEAFYNPILLNTPPQREWTDGLPTIVVDCDGDGTPDWSEIQNQTTPDSDGDGVPDACDCSITPYCVTSPNSAGPGALIGASGSSSASANDLVLTATNCPANVPGIFFVGLNAIQLPLGNGIRCVGAGATGRFPFAHTGAGGVATQPVDNSSIPGGFPVFAGQVLRFQFWYRDTPGGGAGTNLSNALRVEFCQ